MKFQTIMHSSNFMLCIKKVCNVNMPKMTKGHNSRNTFQIYAKVNQVIYSSLPIFSLNFKALAPIFLRYFAEKFPSIYFQRTITQEIGIILIRKENVSYFSMRNPYMKFQIP